jgi:hypothetical protein
LPVFQIELDWLPKDTTFGRRLYKAPDGFAAMLSAVLMGSDRGSIHKPQICLVGQGWTIDQSEATSIRVNQPHPYDLPVMKLTASKVHESENGERVVGRGIYVYWFVSKDQLTAHHGERMWWMARDLIRSGVLQRWAYVTCFAACLPGQEDATFERIKQLVASSVPEFQLTVGRRVGEPSPLADNLSRLSSSP